MFREITEECRVIIRSLNPNYNVLQTILITRETESSVSKAVISFAIRTIPKKLCRFQKNKEIIDLSDLAIRISTSLTQTKINALKELQTQFRSRKRECAHREERVPSMLPLFFPKSRTRSLEYTCAGEPLPQEPRP